MSQVGEPIAQLRDRPGDRVQRGESRYLAALVRPLEIALEDRRRQLRSEAFTWPRFVSNPNVRGAERPLQ